MSFLTKKKLQATMLTKSISSGFSYAESFNKLTIDNKLLDNAKFIVVGTLTPKAGRDNGFFYCSSSALQRQFSLIDNCFNDSYSLEEKRQALIKTPKDLRTINDICCILKNRKIAFLDVVKEAIAKDNDPSDDKIIDYVLDRDSFEELKNVNSNVIFITNSKNAKGALEQILSDIKWSNPNIHLISQNPRTVKGGLKEINKQLSEILKP